MSYIVQHGKLVKVGKRVKGNLYATHPMTSQDVPKMPADKGEFLGSCNRSACLRPGANWYNHSTRKYYCRNCAHELNYDPFNRRDAMEIFGHLLCTEGEHREG